MGSTRAFASRWKVAFLLDWNEIGDPYVEILINAYGDRFIKAVEV